MRRSVAGVAVGLCLAASTALGQTPAATDRPGAGARVSEGDAGHLVLVGVVVREGAPPLALIEDRRTGKQGVYKAGGTIGLVRIAEILEDRVVVVVGTRETEIRLAGVSAPGAPSPPAPPSAALDPPPPLISDAAAGPPPFPRLERATLERYLQASEIATDARPAPDVGVRIERVRPATLFEALGLRPGDIVRSINGHVPGAGLPLARAVAQALADPGLLRVEFERGAQIDAKYFVVAP